MEGKKIEFRTNKGSDLEKEELLTAAGLDAYLQMGIPDTGTIRPRLDTCYVPSTNGTFLGLKDRDLARNMTMQNSQNQFHTFFRQNSTDKNFSEYSLDVQRYHDGQSNLALQTP